MFTQGMHVSPVKHSDVRLPRKCRYRTNRQTSNKVIPMCRYALRAAQKWYLYQTRHVFVKHTCPRQQQSQNMTKSLSPILTPTNLPGACNVKEV